MTAPPAAPLSLFHGLVVDARDDFPISDTHLRLVGSGDTTSTDELGRFLLAVTTGFSGAAFADARGYGRLAFAVDDTHMDPNAPAILRLQRGASLRARVISATGGGIGEVDVILRADVSELTQVDRELTNTFLCEAETWTALTDANGEALLEDLPAGASLRAELRSAGRVPAAAG